MSDGMGREFVYLSSQATNRYWYRSVARWLSKASFLV